MDRMNKKKSIQNIPKQIQKDTVTIFQQSINMVQEYLSLINVPINNNKTQLIIIKNAVNDKNGINKGYNKKNKSKNRNLGHAIDTTDIIENANYELRIIMEKKEWINYGIRVDNGLDLMNK